MNDTEGPLYGTGECVVLYLSICVCVCVSMYVCVCVCVYSIQQMLVCLGPVLGY